MAAGRRRVTMLVRNTMTHDSRVEKEARSLGEVGYRVTVVAEGGDGLPATEERDGYRIVRLARPASRVRGLRLLLHLRSLERLLLRTRPDILHAHDSDALIPVSRAAARLGVPFVLDAHELWLGREPRGRSGLYRRLFAAFYMLVERRHVPRAAAHITVSAPIADYLEQRYRVGPVAVVPNYPRLEAPRAAIVLRHVPGGERIPAGAPLVLHVGSAMSGRGVEQLLDAMRDVLGAHLVLLGPGPAAKDLLARAAHIGVGERVHALEAVATDDVVAAASTATIGVAPIVPNSPNNAASMPNKLFEYLAAGLPVVVSDLPQLRAVVEEADAGVAVDTRNRGAFAAALREMLADPANIERRGRNARRAVEERLNWGVAAEALLAVYRRLPSPDR